MTFDEFPAMPEMAAGSSDSGMGLAPNMTGLPGKRKEGRKRLNAVGKKILRDLSVSQFMAGLKSQISKSQLSK